MAPVTCAKKKGKSKACIRAVANLINPLSGFVYDAGKDITTTFHHPFYEVRRNVFVDAADLKAGDGKQFVLVHNDSGIPAGCKRVVLGVNPGSDALAKQLREEGDPTAQTFNGPKYANINPDSGRPQWMDNVAVSNPSIRLSISLDGSKIPGVTATEPLDVLRARGHGVGLSAGGVA